MVLHDLASLRRSKVDGVLAASPLAAALVMYYAIGVAGLVGALVVTVFQVWILRTIHPYLHLPEGDAQAVATPLLAMVLRSRWLRRAAAHHREHHRTKQGNFNFFPVGDWILGTLVCPSLPDPEARTSRKYLDVLPR